MIGYLLKECWNFKKFLPVSSDFKNHYSKTPNKYYIIGVSLQSKTHDMILKNA